jgi:hypothetical protein
MVPDRGVEPPLSAPDNDSAFVISEIQKSPYVSVELEAPPIHKPSATRTATVFAGRFIDLGALIRDARHRSNVVSVP